jgi:hypothetical protein
VDEHLDDQAGAERRAGAQHSGDPAGGHASDDTAGGSGREECRVTDGADPESFTSDEDEDREHRTQAQVGQSDGERNGAQQLVVCQPADPLADRAAEGRCGAGRR